MKKNETKEIKIFPVLEEFLTYMEVIQGRKELTVKEYRYDLLLFFRYIKKMRDKSALPIEETDISQIDADFLSELSLNEVYRFLTWLSKERNAGAANRSRKISSIKSFFKFVVNKKKLIETNPVQELESPKRVKALPKYLSLEESKTLLRTASENREFPERDYCIITLFLNCGMRLSELSHIKMSDINEDVLTVLGKGGKERSIYLNGACIAALDKYMDVRGTLKPKKEASPYLFISRQGNRLANSSIQRMIKRSMAEAGIDITKFSTHKLRHTAATLMYQYGKVDIRLLQEILGHESIATTEIYTHTDSDDLHKAVESNPLSGVRQKSGGD